MRELIKKRTEDKEESNCWTKSPVNKSVTEHSLYKIDDIKIIDKEPLEGILNEKMSKRIKFIKQISLKNKEPEGSEF